jgi:hypothetical protein
MKRFIFSAVLLLGLSAGPVLAQSSPMGSFLSVKGKVLVKNPSGGSRPAKVGKQVAAGESIVTDKDAEAAVRFFDGSQVALKPGTDFRLVKLEKPSDKDKALKFKILIGELLAKVEKLTSPRSSFEVEAGGVVCGVRGTEFSMRYDSAHHLDLHVSNGSVYAKAGGQTSLFNAGDTGHFTNGQADPSSSQKSGGDSREAKPLSQDLALRDLKAQFVRGLQTNHDNVFTDPSVGGLSIGSITAKVGQIEAGP